MRVLDVEDHATFAAVVTTTFLTEHSVETVGTVRAALQRTFASFDVALVDYDPRRQR